MMVCVAPLSDFLRSPSSVRSRLLGRRARLFGGAGGLSGSGRVQAAQQLRPLAVDVDHKGRDMLAVLSEGAVLPAGALDPLDAVAGRVHLKPHLGAAGGAHTGEDQTFISLLVQDLTRMI